MFMFDPLDTLLVFSGVFIGEFKFFNVRLRIFFNLLYTFC